MRTKPSAAFTLIEVVTAMAIILILTGLVIQLSGYVTMKGSKSRAEGELRMLQAGCENYKAETGAYPQDLQAGLAPGVTDKLKPKEHFVPTASVYEQANLFLYKELTGDKNADGKPEQDEQRYLKEFDARILKADKSSSGQITLVRYFQDPWGYPYGYSTAAAREEMLYRKDLSTKGSAATRPSGDSVPGFNSATYDMWSTGGSRPTSDPTDINKKQLEWAKWVKNW
jgi:prepilin-type N-terminal cleavage/methylation domain-containing protein